MIEEVTNIDKLRGIALDQYGYVTASQAAEAGVTKAALGMLNKRGRVERVSYGVYRIPQVPSTERDRFMLAILWTGAGEAALSHETALDVYGICDINPGKVHVTVAKGRRISRQGGAGYELHREDLAPADLTWWEGIPAVTPCKAIDQCIGYGTPTHLIFQAIDNALMRGFILKGEAEDLRAKLEMRNGGV